MVMVLVKKCSTRLKDGTPEVFYKKAVPEGLQLYQKETPIQVFPCEYCEIFKNTYSEENLRLFASDYTSSYPITT